MSGASRLAIFGTYARAALALLLPAATYYFSPRVMDSQLMTDAFDAAGGPLPLVSAIAILIVVELFCLVALGQLIRFRGKATHLLDWRSGAVVVSAQRRRHLRTATVAGGVLLGLLVAETVVRTFDLYDPDRATAIVDYTRLLHEPRNRLGIREKWDFLDPADSRFRIAVLGDSIVYGLGVPGETTFTALLEQELQNEWPQGVVTINLGGPGTAPEQQLTTFVGIQGELRPDLVIHVLYPNDLGGVELRHLAKQVHGVRTEPYWTGGFSRILHLIETRIRERVIWRGALAYYRGGLTAPDRELAWVKLEADVKACRDAVRESGADYLIVLFPWLIELSDYPIKDVHDRIQAMAEELGAPYLDLLGAFEGMQAAEYRFYPTDEHPNEAGHTIAAKEIARFVREQWGGRVREE